MEADPIPPAVSHAAMATALEELHGRVWVPRQQAAGPASDRGRVRTVGGFRVLSVPKRLRPFLPDQTPGFDPTEPDPVPELVFDQSLFEAWED